MPQIRSVCLIVDSSVLEVAGYMLFCREVTSSFFQALTFMLIYSRYIEKQLKLLSGCKTYFILWY
jgi:hypothetical protein